MDLIDLTDEPQRVARERWDAIWIELPLGEEPGPLESPVLQWLDWKLQGQLSRLVIGGRGTDPVVIPTMKKIPSPYLVVVPQVGWPHLQATSAGMGLKQVLVLCEGKSRAEKLLSQAPAGGPDSVGVAFEAPRGGV